MKYLKYVTSKLLIITLLCTFIMNIQNVQAAESRKGLGYKWKNKTDTILFYCTFNDTWINAIQNAMNSWNNVTDAVTNRPIVQMGFTNQSSSNNRIYRTTTTSDTNWIARMNPSLSNGFFQSANIVFNMAQYNFTVGSSADKYDIQSVAVHELGHALGIAHCHESYEGSCFSSTCDQNVMNPHGQVNSTKRTLTNYDRSSKQAIYM